MTSSIRTSILFLAALALLLGGASAARADDPGDDFPPPSDETPAGETPPAEAPAKEAPAKEAPAKEAPAANTGWSPPAVTPGPRRDLSSLPPPRVVRRRSNQPRTTPARSAPARSTAGNTPRSAYTPPVSNPPVNNPPVFNPSVDRPAAPPSGSAAPSTGFVPITPRDDLPGAAGTGTQPSVRTPVARTPASAGTSTDTGRSGLGGSRIFGITKTHNVALDRGPGTEQDLALQIDVDYELLGQARRDVYVAIWFARKADGTLVKSAVPTYGDRSGNATLQTRAARVAGDAARFKATLRIPYRAFPMSQGEASYDVEARVQVLRTETNGRVTVLCRGSTTFRVYGYDEGQEPAEGAAPSAPALDRTGISDAGESGFINDR